MDMKGFAVLALVCLATPLCLASHSWPDDVEFTPSGKAAGFSHLKNKLISKVAPAGHWSNDAFALAKASVEIKGTFQYNLVPSGIISSAYLKDELVEGFIYVNQAWTSLGQAKTDDNGSVSFKLPTLEAGRYPFRFLVIGDYTVSKSSAVVLNDKTDLVTFDIDGTLTESDSGSVLDIIADILNLKYQAKPWDGAVDIVSTYVNKGYAILYLTGRPGSLRKFTEKWLVENKFPVGALIETDGVKSALDPQPYKAGSLKMVKNNADVQLVAGYGNEPTDVNAYLEAGIDKTMAFTIGKKAGTEGSVPIKSYPEHLPFVQALPDATVPSPDAADA